MDETTTFESEGEEKTASKPHLLPVLLLASAPGATFAVDRCAVSAKFTVGRSVEASLVGQDKRLSRKHFAIRALKNSFQIEDFNSRNGTYLNGVSISGKNDLPSPSVIRAGQSVFVFLCGSNSLMDPPPEENWGIIGNFHSRSLLKTLNEASFSARHILIAGPSGSGKELAAKSLAAMVRDTPARAKSSSVAGKILTHNAARFASEEECATTLFGVGPRVFSSVDARPGMIEEARDGVLFLDEAHGLPKRIQRSLLRVIQENETSRIGESKSRPANVRFVFATNKPAPCYGLEKDLLARLRIVQVPPLKQRIADIPSLFFHLLDQTFQAHGLNTDELTSHIGPAFIEKLLLDGFPDENVRALVDLTDRLATGIEAGSPPDEVVATVTDERFAEKPCSIPENVPPSGQGASNSNSSHYLRHKDTIIDAYHQSKGNLSATERLVLSMGIKCSRRWIRAYLKEWGVYGKIRSR